jgi:1,4-dihydroxy-2-naphthoate octaprenyltransferase
MGSFLAIASGIYNNHVIGLSVLTTLLLQILSNLANDYGDGMKGTDNKDRLGPKRTIQSGEISPKQMKIAIVIFVLLSLASGIWLIVEAFGSDWYLGLVFLLLGLAAIAAAIKYTVGKNAYGYSGLGDVFVFLFFGLLAVLGAYFLNTLQLKIEILLPAISIGLFSTGVLNLNNMRDIKNDLQSGKNTLASFMGITKAKKYHLVLISGAMISAVLFSIIEYSSPWNFIYLITFPMFIFQLLNILKTKEEQLLDPFLKKLALTTLLFSLLFGIGLIL